jgi:hypothetical protein
MDGWFAPDRRDIELSPYKKLIVEGLVFHRKQAINHIKTVDGPGGVGVPYDAIKRTIRETSDELFTTHGT